MRVRRHSCWPCRGFRGAHRQAAAALVRFYRPQLVQDAVHKKEQLPQQIFRRWAGGQITLAAAAQHADTSSSHQKLNFSQLIEKYRAFVPNAGDNTWKTFDLPVLRNYAKAFQDRPPVDGEALAMQCLSQWEQGSRMRQTSRQKFYGFLNWAAPREPRQSRGDSTRCFCVMLMVPPLIGGFRLDSKSGRNFRL